VARDLDEERRVDRDQREQVQAAWSLAKSRQLTGQFHLPVCGL
jgi:hypothetical protein